MAKSKYEAALDEMLEGEIFQNHVAKDYVLNCVLEDEEKLAKCTKQELLVLIRKSFVVICIELGKQTKLLSENTQKTKKIEVIKIALPFYKKAVEKETKSEAASKSVQTKLANNPVQLAKKEIEKEYELVKIKFKRHGYSAQFIRDMHAKYPVIVDSDTIKKLVTKLNKSNELIPVS